ncbi:hypothetical protein SNEBB_007964 [Seison nebaliae]|nr:hypothetical protein SNEBB_007964 [Seison nebaliae]
MKQTIEERVAHLTYTANHFRDATLIVSNKDGDGEVSHKIKIPLVLIHKKDKESQANANYNASAQNGGEIGGDSSNETNELRFADVAQMYFEDVPKVKKLRKEAIVLTCVRLKDEEGDGDETNSQNSDTHIDTESRNETNSQKGVMVDVVDEGKNSCDDGEKSDGDDDEKSNDDETTDGRENEQENDICDYDNKPAANTELSNPETVISLTFKSSSDSPTPLDKSFGIKAIPTKYKKTDDLSNYIPKSGMAKIIEQKLNVNRVEKESSESEESENQSIIFLSDKSSSTDDEEDDQISNSSSHQTDKRLMVRKHLNDYSDNEETRVRRHESGTEVTCDFKIVKRKNYHYTQEKETDNEIKVNPYEEIEGVGGFDGRTQTTSKTDDSDEDAETLPTVIDSQVESHKSNIKLPIQSTHRYNSSSAYPRQFTLSPNESLEEETSVSLSSFKSDEMTDEAIEKLDSDFEDIKNQSQTFPHIGALVQTMAAKEWVNCGEFLRGHLNHITNIGKMWPVFIENKGISELSIIYQMFSIYESKFFKKTKKLAEHCSAGNTDIHNKKSDTMKLVYKLTRMPGWIQLCSWENQIRGYIDELCSSGSISSHSSLGPSYVRIFNRRQD